MAETCNRKTSRLFIETALFALIAVFLVWRIHYGYYNADENFLFGLAQRFYYGDAIISDEWHVCQHAGLFLYPFYLLYYGIFQTVYGMSLFFRYLYCGIYFLFLIYMHRKLSHLGPSIYFVILCTALYTPLDHMTLSYTTLSFIFILLIILIIYKDVLTDRAPAKKTGLILGLLFTGITLCYPYFAAVFAVAYIAVLVLFIFFRKDKNIFYLSLLAFWSAISIALSVVLYCMFVFSRTDINSIFDNLPQIFNDPQHPSRPFFFSIYDALYTSLMTGRESLSSGLVYYGTTSVLAIASFFSKRLRKNRALIIFLMFPLWLYNEIDIFIDSAYKLNRQMKDIFMIGILAFALLKRRPWKLFLSFYVSSVIYLLVTWLCSNTGLHVLSMGYAPGSICAVIILCLFVKEINEEYKSMGWRRAVAMSGAILLIFSQSVLELKVRLYGTYHDMPMSYMTEKIEHGPSKGIYTSPKCYTEYYDEYNIVTVLMRGIEKEGKTLLALNSSPLVYLVADMPCASYSKWMLGDENTEERVRLYYDINDCEAPDFIYDHTSDADISIITDAEYEFIEYSGARLYLKK